MWIFVYLDVSNQTFLRIMRRFVVAEGKLGKLTIETYNFFLILCDS